MKTLKDRKAEIEREISELMDKGEQQGNGKILADLDNKLNPIEIIALDDNLNVGQLKAELKGLQEGARLQREKILEIIDEWFIEEMQDVFPLEDLNKLKRRIRQLR